MVKIPKKYKEGKHIKNCGKNKSLLFLYFIQIVSSYKIGKQPSYNYFFYTSGLYVRVEHQTLSGKISHMSDVNISATGHCV